MLNLKGLNAPQREAVSILSGPLLVLAGAGTGKTRVITYRMANLIAHGIRPDRILSVTFTNKAAREMRARAASLLGKQFKQKPVVSTFHAWCVRALREDIDVLGYPKGLSFMIAAIRVSRSNRHQRYPARRRGHEPGRPAQPHQPLENVWHHRN